MRLRDVISRVRSECPGFAQVDHALSSAEELDYPAALVSPVLATPQPPRLLGVHSQEEVLTFGVFILLQRRRDGDTDAGAADDLDDLRAELRAALIGWTPAAEFTALAAAGGRLDQWRPGIAGWREDFSTTHEILKI
ncbi:MAG: hypothetical protein ACK4S2_06970 [Gemmobacter sp.]|uniref:phage tail terminator protein n=1 Tax=Gemmobacter sp. TaxID=1898957 RepID=UPI00391AA53B